MLPLIDDRAELLGSLRAFSRLLTSAGHESADCRELLARGLCFAAYQHDEQQRFAPSRFIGYRGNSPSLHRQAGARPHGGKTNAAISKTLGSEPVPGYYESQYVEYCRRLGVLPAAVFGGKRKYWPLVVDLRMPVSSSSS